MKMPRNRNFILHSTGQFISRLGDVLAFMSLSFWVLQKSGSSAQFAMLLVPVAAIQFFLQPLISPFVDRFSRKKMMIISDLARMLTSIIAFLMIKFDYFNLNALVLISCFGALFTASFEASVAGIARFLVADSDVHDAIRINQVLSGLKSFLNPAIAGALLGLLGPANCVLLNVISYCIALVCNSLLEIHQSLKKDQPGSAQQIFKTWWVDLKAGFISLLDAKVVLYSLFLIGGFQFIFSHLSISLPIFILKERGLAAWNLGLGESALGLGGIIGALTLNFTNRLLPGRKLWVGSIFFAGLSVIFLGQSAQFGLSMLGMFIMMVLHTSLNLHFQTRIALAIPKNFQGRVFSFISLFISGTLPLGFAVSGRLIETYSASALISVSGFLCLGLVPLIFFIPYLDKFLLAPKDKVPEFIREHYPKAFVEIN